MVIEIKRTRKYHEPVFATELIFCNNPIGKSCWLLRGNQSDASFQVCQQKYVIPAALYSDIKKRHLDVYRPDIVLLLAKTQNSCPVWLIFLGIYHTCIYNTICKQRVGCNKDHACFEHLQVFSVNSYTSSIINNTFFSQS